MEKNESAYPQLMKGLKKSSLERQIVSILSYVEQIDIILFSVVNTIDENNTMIHGAIRSCRLIIEKIDKRIDTNECLDLCIALGEMLIFLFENMPSGVDNKTFQKICVSYSKISEKCEDSRISAINKQLSQLEC